MLSSDQIVDDIIEGTSNKKTFDVHFHQADWVTITVDPNTRYEKSTDHVLSNKDGNKFARDLIKRLLSTGYSPSNMGDYMSLLKNIRMFGGVI